MANGEFARKHLKPFGFSVVQIDDEWQTKVPKGSDYGDWEKNWWREGPIKVFCDSNEKFPNGRKYLAEKLKAMDLVPGICFMHLAGTWNNPYFADKQDLFAHWPDGKPVATMWSGTRLDLSNPKTQKFVYDRVKRINDWGYEYFKLDGMHAGMVTHNVSRNSSYYENQAYNQHRTGANSNFVASQSHVLL